MIKELKNKLNLIVEHCSAEKTACRNCSFYNDNTCNFGCVNERNGIRYRVNTGKLTTPDYSCSHFNNTYKFNNDTVDVLKDILEDIKRVEDAEKNIELLLCGKINESDFVDIMR